MNELRKDGKIQDSSSLPETSAALNLGNEKDDPESCEKSWDHVDSRELQPPLQQAELQWKNKLELASAEDGGERSVPAERYLTDYGILVFILDFHQFSFNCRTSEVWESNPDYPGKFKATSGQNPRPKITKRGKKPTNKIKGVKEEKRVKNM